MLTICPVCQQPKSPRFEMCKECYDLYGRNREEWPLYVAFLVADDNRLEWQEEQIREHEVTLADFAPEIQDALENGYLAGEKVA